MLASCIQPPPASLCFCGGCSPRYIGWLPLRRGFKTACVGVGVAMGWPLANQQPAVAGHPRPTWSTSPNIHIDLVVLADRRAAPTRSATLRITHSYSTSQSISFYPMFVQLRVSFSMYRVPTPERVPSTLVDDPSTTEREKVVCLTSVQGNFESKRRRLVFHGPRFTNGGWLARGGRTRSTETSRFRRRYRVESRGIEIVRTMERLRSRHKVAVWRGWEKRNGAD